MIIATVATGKINLAFWILTIPVLVYFGMCDPKKGIIFLFLFTILDNTPMTKLYEKHFIHAVSISGVILDAHLIVMLVLFFSWVLRMMLKCRKIKIDVYITLLLLLLGLWMIKDLILTMQLSILFEIIFVFFFIMVSQYFIFSEELTDEKDILYVLRYVGFATAVMCIYGFYQLISGNVYPSFFTVGILGGGIAIGMYLPIFTYCTYLFLSNDKGQKILSFVIVILFFIIISATAKRAVLVGGITGLLTAALLIYRKKLARLIILAAPVAIILFFIISKLLFSGFFSAKVSGFAQNRMASIIDPETDISAMMRVAQWVTGLELIKENTITGISMDKDFIVGTGFFKMTNVLDSDFLFIAVKGGLIVLLIFILIQILFFRKGISLLNQVENNLQLKPLLIGAIATVAGIMTTSVFQVNIVKVRVFPWLLLSYAIVSIISRSSTSVKSVKK